MERRERDDQPKQTLILSNYHKSFFESTGSFWGTLYTAWSSNIGIPRNKNSPPTAVGYYA